MNREELKQLITDTFAAVPRPAPDNVGDQHHCDECGGLVESFTDVTWQTIPPAVIDTNFDKLPLFCPVAYHHFLPVFLQRSVDEPEGRTREFTFYFLTTKPCDWFDERTRLFSAPQIRCIISYLEFEQAQFEELQHWLATGKVMAKRLTYWKSLLDKA